MNNTPTPPTSAKKASKRRGVVLIAVLVVITLLSLAGYQYSEMMLAEYKVAEFAHRNMQAECFAKAGVHYAMAMLSNPDNFYNTLGGNPYDNPALFQDHAIETEAGVKGRFSLIAPADPSDPTKGIAFGVWDEGSKINLNAMMKRDPTGKEAHDVLMMLPNMTEDIALAIVDWMDADSDTRPGGAESDYYLGLNPQYRAKNGPIDSIDELLLVRGVTRDLLYGSDWNRNGAQDASEGTQGFDRGWSAFLTVHSREQNHDVAGKPFIFINNPDLSQLKLALEEAEIDENLIKFIIMRRQEGPMSSKGGQQSVGGSIAAMLGLGGQKSANAEYVDGDLSTYEINLKKKGKNLESIFDLVEGYVSIKGKTDQKSKKTTYTIYASPLNDANMMQTELPKLYNIVTFVDPTTETEIPPRINVNTAPMEVLATLAFSETELAKIVSIRPTLGSGELVADPIYQTPAWLYTEAQVSVERLRLLEKYITTRTQVFRVQSVGYFENGGPAVRVEAVIDTNGGRPRVIAWRNMTNLGKGWTSEENP